MKMTWAERSDAALAQGCLTYSKRRDQFVEGVYPTHVKNGFGAFIEAAGKTYTDYVCGLGANLIDIRNSFSLPTTDEVVLAERIKSLFPCIDKLKILKTGSAACEAAIRIARAYTGKTETIGTGYHGTCNVFIAAEMPGAGCVDEGYCKIESLARLVRYLNIRGYGGQRMNVDDVAAVIIEPVQLDLAVEDDLRALRRICTEERIVLVFDEVISGFRVPRYSFANYFGIQPDLIVLGKALGNGYPIAIVGGREDIMETPGYFISNTHNGEVSAIGAALETMDFLTEEKLQEHWDKGAWFLREFNQLNPKVQIVGYPTRGELHGDDLTKALFMQQMVRAGYFFGKPWFHTFAHTKEVMQRTLDAARLAFMQIEAGMVTLEGQLPRPIFKRN
jgi:glutamate-1-semialdehyde 2,1-aminomutase